VKGDVLAVLGLGYMGGSVALAARRAGVVQTVVGYDPDPQVAPVALERGIADRLAGTAAQAVAGAGVVVLAGPVQSLGATLTAIAPAVAAEALVVDIGSVKAPVVAAAEGTSLADRFVGCHPLAGTEATGPAAARPDLYAGKPLFVCPTARTPAQVLARARGFWQALGATVLDLDPDTHDVFMAAASHLPHVSAYALVETLTGQADMLALRIPPSFPPTSLRDASRVAASNPRIWRDILLANRTHLLPLVRALEESLGRLRRGLEAEDARAVEEYLERGRACRQKIVG